MRTRFWRLPLHELTPQEWEALCDGCGKCCLLKLEDEDTGHVDYTTVACRLLDDETCRCMNYRLRKQLVPQCIVLTPKTLRDHAGWLPKTCAYRRLFEGSPLPDWHPLITGDPDSTRKAGMSVAHRTVPEYEVDEDDLEDFIIEEDL